MNTKDSLPIMEDFYTIQGEGFNQGRSAYFIRIAGCDVGCIWCDVKESWSVEDNQFEKIKSLVEKANAFNSRFAVITGGEPLMYKLDNLTKLFIENGYELAIETSGAYPLSGDWHWICLSPKKFKKPLEDIYSKANELKIIIYNKSDFKWAEDHAKKVNKDCILYLQVEWSVRDKMTPILIDYVKNNPQWRISNQTHKYLNIP